MEKNKIKTPSHESRLHELWSTWDALRDSLSNGDLEALHTKLSETLSNICKDAPLAQLMLVEKSQYRVFFLLNSLRPNWISQLGPTTKLRGAELLGSNLKDTFFGTILKEEPPAFRALLRHSDDPSNNLGGRYIVHKAPSLNTFLRNGEWKLEPAIKKDRTQSDFEELSFPGNDDEVLQKKFGRWFERIVLIPFSCAQIIDLPGINGLAFFFLEPGDKKVKNKDDRISKFKEQVRAAGDLLLDMTRFVQAVAFTVQTYALSQATAHAPERLYQELLSRRFIDLFNDILKKKPTNARENLIRRLVTDILLLPDEFVRRSTMKNIVGQAKGNSHMSNILIDQFTMLIRGDSTNSEMECLQSEEYFKTEYPERKDNIGEMVSNTALNSLAAADVFYAFQNPTAKDDFVRTVVIPALGFYGLGSDGDKSNIETGYEVALACLEDIYSAVASDETKNILLRLWIKEIESAIEKGYLSERLVVSSLLLLLLSNSFEQQSQDRYCELAAKALHIWLASGQRLQYACPFITALPEQTRNDLLHKTSCIDGAVVEQIQGIVTQQRRISRSKRHAEGVRKQGFPEVISVLSSKGGVGKTTVAIGMAASLAARSDNPKVCIVDLDFFGPTLEFTLDIRQNTEDRIHLNDYVWARYLPQFEDLARKSKSARDEMGRIFQYRNFWHKRYLDLSTMKRKELFSRTPSETCEPRVQYIACSTNEESQELMLPFLGSPGGNQALGAALQDLLVDIHNAGYNYIILDCPAELKEISLFATEMSTKYDGRSVFVTTLYEPSLVPLLTTMSTGYQQQSRNYLLFNKLRPLDKKYVENIESVLELWRMLAPHCGFPGARHMSTALLETILNLEVEDLGLVGLGCIEWSEFLERLIEQPAPIRIEDWAKLVTQMKQVSFGFLYELPPKKIEGDLS